MKKKTYYISVYVNSELPAVSPDGCQFIFMKNCPLIKTATDVLHLTERCQELFQNGRTKLVSWMPIQEPDPSKFRLYDYEDKSFTVAEADRQMFKRLEETHKK